MNTNFPCGFPHDDEPLMATAIWPRESPVSNTAGRESVGVRLPPSLLTEAQPQICVTCGSAVGHLRYRRSPEAVVELPTPERLLKP